MKQIIVLVVVILWWHMATAKDFGMYGTTFGVKEEGFIAMIQRKLKLVDIEKEQKKMLETVKQRINEPLAAAILPRTQKAASFIYDPTYIVPEDIILPNGKILHPVGTKINPLDNINLHKKLVFIDGNDENQIKWFKQAEDAELINVEDKLILVAGRPIDLKEELGREVYFDQAGRLTKKFKIRQVPATIEQEGNMLRIKEIAID